MVAADIVDYIREMRADPEFFSVMTRSFPDEMYWVPEAELKRLRVLNGNIFDEREEYMNSEGHFYLRLWQQSREGENKMVVACVDDSPLFIAYLQPPEFYMNGSFELIIDAKRYEPEHWDVSRDPNSDGSRWVVVSFRPTPAQLHGIINATSVGARMVFPSGDLFFGFEMTIRSTKIRDTLADCKGRTSNSASEPVPDQTSTMVDLPDMDIPGGDMLEDGLRGLSFEQCKQLCLGIDGCQAVSWVASLRWCWPKREINAPSSAEGIVSAIRR